MPVRPDSFEAGLQKLGIEFYLSGFCSWDNYMKFLGYLERIHHAAGDRAGNDAARRSLHPLDRWLGLSACLEGGGLSTYNSTSFLNVSQSWLMQGLLQSALF